MLESLKGKVAWVTGAGTGIGQAGAVMLAKNGATVVLSGRRMETLRETLTTIEKNGGIAVPEILDVADADAVQAVSDRIAARWGRLDILVNNAGTNVTERHWNQVTPESGRRSSTST